MPPVLAACLLGSGFRRGQRGAAGAGLPPKARRLSARRRNGGPPPGFLLRRSAKRFSRRAFAPLQVFSFLESWPAAPWRLRRWARHLASGGVRPRGAKGAAHAELAGSSGEGAAGRQEGPSDFVSGARRGQGRLRWPARHFVGWLFVGGRALKIFRAYFSKRPAPFFLAFGGGAGVCRGAAARRRPRGFGLDT